MTLKDSQFQDSSITSPRLLTLSPLVRCCCCWIMLWLVLPCIAGCGSDIQCARHIYIRRCARWGLWLLPGPSQAAAEGL